MVQSYQSPVKVYKTPFELIMTAYVRRFPTCEMIPIMAHTEVISEETIDGGAVTVTTRRCKLLVEAPYLLKKLMGVEYVFFTQKNTFDRRARTLQIEAKNESFLSRVVIHEDCRYFVHPEDSLWTCFEQTASLDVKSFFGFESTVEKLAMKQYSQNISKGKEIIEYFLNELAEEGIRSVPIWQRPKKTSFSNSVRRKSSSKVVEEEDEMVEEDEEEEEEEVEEEEVEEKVGDVKKIAAANKDALSKLDSDYIKRCLGDLSPLQESRLVQLKKWVAELQKGKVPSDTTLLRFLRARDFNVEKAREMLSQSLIWRKRNRIDKLVADYRTPAVINDYFPGGWHHQDKDGRPLYLLRLGQMDVKGLVKSVGEEALLLHTLSICEEGLRLTSEATEAQGKPVTTWSLLVDLDGLNMRHLWRPGIRTLLNIIEIVENNYPETMSQVLIVRAPRVFPILWTLVSSFIDEHTRTKFLFYGGNDYQCSGGLVDYMAKEHIPDFLEGECKNDVVEGGLVPKNLYLPGEEIDGSRPPVGPARLSLAPSNESVYHSVSLARGQVHEVVLNLSEAGSVLCWDFDVMKSDVAFTVLRSKDLLPISPQQKEPPHSPIGALGVMEGSLFGGDASHHSVIEKGAKEGVNYFRVEPALVCHDGESVQGSHVTSEVGTYILQWKPHEVPHLHGTSALDIIDTITAHKAKLMYCYETLKSADYKGSMTSLQSCQSGFSHLSTTTGKSSLNSSLNSSCPSR